MLLTRACSLLLAGAGTAIAVSAQDTTTYNLLHRVGSFDKAGEWSIRGTIELSPTDKSTLAPIAADGDNANATQTSSTGPKVISTLSPSEVKALHDQAWTSEASELVYELALSPQHSLSSLDGLPTTSVKLCHLRQSHKELLTLDDQVTLHMRYSAPVADKSAVATPYGLSYRVLDIQLNADGCPTTSSKKMQTVQEEIRREKQRQAMRRSRRYANKDEAAASTTTVTPALEFKTNLHISSPSKPKSPPLKAPLPTREDGTVVPPEPEKTLLQKYWYYLIPVALVILMPSGEDDPAKAGAEGHASSEAAGNGMGAKRLK